MHALIFILITLFVPACLAPKGDIPEFSREIARVDDFVIEEDLLRFKLRLTINELPGMENPEDLHAFANSADYKETLRLVLEKIINDYTIMAYAERLKIPVPPEEVANEVAERKKQWNPKAFDDLLRDLNITYNRWKKLKEDEVKVQYILNKVLAKDLKVGLGEITDYYRRNETEFRTQERVRARQIVTDTIQKAQEIHERLVSGENFAKVAVNHSLSPDRARGGDLGYFARGTFPREFDDTCFSLQKGEISPVIKSDYGFHVFKVLDKKPAGLKSLDEVLPEIHQKLFAEKLKTKYENWIQSARLLVKVSLNQEIIDQFIL